jgi:predicted peptidase
MTATPQQVERVFAAGRERLHYLLALPPGYDLDAERRWPLMLFLHGAGERGDDIGLVRGYGIPKAIDDGFEIPAIAVSPQCPAGERWSASLLAALLDAVEAELRVGPDRIYLTGLSMGGFGAWALALAQPHRFAALVPVCGGGDARAVGVLRHLPVWAFHGARDDVVPLLRSEEMVEALQRAGGDVRFTVYPNAGHDSWTAAYAEPELYRWLFAQRRRSQ